MIIRRSCCPPISLTPARRPWQPVVPWTPNGIAEQAIGPGTHQRFDYRGRNITPAGRCARRHPSAIPKRRAEPANRLIDLSRPNASASMDRRQPDMSTAALCRNSKVEGAGVRALAPAASQVRDASVTGRVLRSGTSAAGRCSGVTAASDESTLHLIGGPYVVAGGRRVSVPEGSKRLVAFVALKGRRVERSYAAEVLWPDADPSRAAGNLRSAMWRVRVAGLDILIADKSSLSLHPGLRVDIEGVTAWANRVATGAIEATDLDLLPMTLQALDLLPGWYDDWVLLESAPASGRASWRRSKRSPRSSSTRTGAGRRSTPH